MSSSHNSNPGEKIFSFLFETVFSDPECLTLLVDRDSLLSLRVRMLEATCRQRFLPIIVKENASFTHVHSLLSCIMYQIRAPYRQPGTIDLSVVFPDWFSPLTAHFPWCTTSFWFTLSYACLWPLHIQAPSIQNNFHSILPSPLWSHPSPSTSDTYIFFFNLFPLFLSTHLNHFNTPFSDLSTILFL